MKNRLGFTREEAKKIFQSFRSGKTPEPDGAEEPPRKDDDKSKGHGQEKQPERVRAARAVTPEVAKGGSDMTRVVRYMEETNQRLDHIEKDMDYLKGQVDRILAKI
jgi:hypothetical protein